MKQKNLILMVVAVGCGLLAAFLTSQMSAKPSGPPPLVKVLVVAKELPPGTKFTLDSIKDQFKEKMINAESIPEKGAYSEEQLDGKTLNKTMRMDDFVREFDLGNYQPLDPPEGKHIITLRLPIDKITPFVQPASRVDIMGTAQTQEGKVKAAVLIPNILVMATDVKVAQPNGGTHGEMTIQLVSVAASKEEALAVRVCEAAGVKLSFILRSDNTKSTTEFDLAKVQEWCNHDEAQVKAAPEAKTTTPEAPKEVLAKVYVPTSDIPAGTELTSDVLSTKFKEIPWQGALPANAVEKIKDHVGRFIIKDVYTDMPVPKQCLADAMPKKAEVAKAKTGENAEPLIKPAPPEEVVKAKNTFERTYVTPNGIRIIRYEILENGDLKVLGEGPGEAPQPKKDDAEPKKVS